MNHIVIDYTAYNEWANKKLSSFVLKLDEKLLDEPMHSSFPTIRKTIAHIWDAQYTWLRRLNNKNPEDFPSTTFKGDFDELVKRLLDTSAEFSNYASQQDILSIEKVITYTNAKGVPFHNKVYEIIMHGMNHSTYHRGQVVTMLREVGYTEIGTLDMINYYRQREIK